MYGVTALVYIGLIVSGFRLVDNIGLLFSWTVGAAIGSSVLIVWISVLNFFYLLTQMVIAVDDVSVRNGILGAVRFVRSSLREIAGVFGVVLLLVAIATVGSILAAAGLGVIAFVPLVGLAVVPLQVAGWLLRGFVFQYLGADGTQRVSDILPSRPPRERSAPSAPRGCFGSVSRTGAAQDQGARSARTAVERLA